MAHVDDRRRALVVLAGEGEAAFVSRRCDTIAAASRKETLMPATATTKRHPISPADNALLKAVVDPQISPDGERVAYVVRGVDSEKNERQTSIWVAPLDGKSPARRFTFGTKDHSPRWSPDGRFLAFVSDRGDKNQVMLAPLDGGESRTLTSAPHGVNELAWSPDGSRVAYLERVGEWKDGKELVAVEKVAPRVIKHLRYRLDTVGYFDDRRTHIFVADIESGESKQITSGDYYDQQIAWSPDGKRIAFASDREPKRHDRQFRADIWVVPASGGVPKKLTRSRGAANWPAFSPDGKTIAYLGHEHGDAASGKNTHVMVVPTTGAAAPRSVSASVDQTVPSAGLAQRWSRDGKSIFFLVQEHGNQALYRANVPSGDATRVLDGDRQVFQYAMTRDDRQIAFTAASASRPQELYATTLAGGARERNLSRANDDFLAACEPGSHKRMTHRAPDGLEIESFVLYPPAYRAGQRYPLVLYIHGGPHAQHPLWGFAMRPQTLAGAGYVVLMPNPRGSSGYGEAFMEMCTRDWGGADYRDLMASVDTLVRKGVADPERLFVTGYSYGGFMTTWVVGHTDRFKAAIIGAPVADHISMLGTTEIPHFSQQEVTSPWDDLQATWEGSPLSHLPNCTTPVLIEHHEGDLRCPIGQAEEVFQTLKMLGKEVEFVRYPGGFHILEFHAPSQDLDYQQRQIDWFDTHGGRAKPRTSRKRARVSANGAKAQVNGTRAAKKALPA
jgi:dipeptidyl aminopeptidase/acylaminoacyl peptidase